MELDKNSPSPIAGTNPLTQEITANNANFGLLRLPQEIKQLIYESVLGSQLIHIRRDPKKSGYKFTHYLCQAKHSEKEAEEIFAASKEPWYLADIQSRHEACYPPSSRDACFQCRKHNDIATKSYARLSLEFLRCCRQMYQEARSMTFSNATFSFLYYWDISLFCDLPWRQIHSNIRSLRLDIIIGSNSEEYWWNKALERLANNFQSLQHIYINVDQRAEGDQYLTEWNFKKPAECSFLRGLRSLMHLKLKTATVIISDYHISHTILPSQQERWTMLQKQKWAGYTKRVLLNQEEQEPAIGEVE